MSRWWSSTECYSVTDADGTEKQPHTPLLSPDKHGCILSSATWGHTIRRWFDSRWSLAAASFYGILYVAMLGFQVFLTACGSMCRPFLCQQCHVYLRQGQRDTNCTTICVIIESVFHNFYLWNILCNRFFCRSDEQKKYHVPYSLQEIIAHLAGNHVVWGHWRPLLQFWNWCLYSALWCGSLFNI